MSEANNDIYKTSSVLQNSESFKFFGYNLIPLNMISRQIKCYFNLSIYLKELKGIRIYQRVIAYEFKDNEYVRGFSMN